MVQLGWRLGEEKQRAGFSHRPATRRRKEKHTPSFNHTDYPGVEYLTSPHYNFGHMAAISGGSGCDWLSFSERTAFIRLEVAEGNPTQTFKRDDLAYLTAFEISELRRPQTRQGYFRQGNAPGW